MKVYVVQREDYDDQEIMGIFDTREAAEKLFKKLKDEEKKDHIERCKARKVSPEDFGYGSCYDKVKEFTLNKRVK